MHNLATLETLDIHNNVAVLSNKLLKASHFLSIGEKRLIYLALSIIKPRLLKKDSETGEIIELPGDEVTEDSVFQIDAETYSKVFNVDLKNSYYTLESAARSLLHREIRFDIGKNKKDTLVFNWVDLNVLYKNGNVGIRFSRYIIPYISQLSEYFQQFKIRDIVQFENVYSWRLFEIFLTENKSPKFIKKVKYSVENLYELLAVDDSYRRYGNFKKFILLPALDELELVDSPKLIHFSIDEKTGLSFKEIKRGRKVIELEFEFCFREKKDFSKEEIEIGVDSPLENL